jgi:predicted house-cleaning noncanonical NTP pyrophosphatase (MazG superfamily)/quercetin dioxygenase-like cupin family protein
MKSSAESGNKAIRDRIPEILRNSGKDCAVKELSDFEFLVELEGKLEEELTEYLESKDVEELADLLEVIYRISELRGFSKEFLESLRLKKRQEKGGFEKNLFLFNTPDEKCLSESSAASEEFPCVVFRPDKSEVIEKHGVRMRIYTTKNDSSNAAVLYQETDTGHAEEFVHEKSDFLYYILAGSGTWVVEDREFEVRAGDVVVVPAGKRFWFRGNLRQICITAPAWEEKYERHIRDIEL